MNPIVFATFPDWSSAQAAADHLDIAGADRREVRIHDRLASAPQTTALEIDEMATGGFVGNFAALFDQLFQFKPDASAVTYGEVARQEGTVVSVSARTHDDADGVAEALKARGAIRVARLPQPGLGD